MRFNRSITAFLFLAMLLALPPAAKAGDEVLNNAAIIELQGLNLGDAIVIQKINTSKCNFDTSIAGLKQLKAANVSGAVTAAMMSAGTPAATPAAPAFLTLRGSKNDKVVRDTRRTLAVVGTKDFIPFIKRLLNSPDEKVRADAANAIDIARFR